MSAAPSSALESAPRRAFPRHPLHVPLDVIVLRSGVPENVPGRCTDVNEAGVGAIVAGELPAGQLVGVELKLPNVGVPVRARAMVRYQEQLRCGLQFVGLPLEQREMIRYWAYRQNSQGNQGAQQDEAPRDEAAASTGREADRRTRKIRVRLSRLYLLCAVAGLLLGVGWWRWQRSWNELEPSTTAAAEKRSPLRVAPEVMERQVAYRVNPVYPEEARLAGIEGLVVLDALIGEDGSVQRVKLVSGPKVLGQAAAEAVQSWKFDPYQSEGKEVEVETTIAIDFRMN